MTSHYFKNKAIAALFRDEIDLEHLNDDCFARRLDKIAEYRTTKLFSEIALQVAQKQNLLRNAFHLDSTSFTLYGNYGGTTDSLLPTYRFSKANQPNLKQVILSPTQDDVTNLPLWIET